MLEPRRSQGVHIQCHSGSTNKQLYKKADEVKLSQPVPSFSRGLNPSPRKVSEPPDGCSVTEPLRRCGIAPFLLSPCCPTGCPESSMREQKDMKAIDLLASRGTQRHRGLSTVAVLAVLFFCDKKAISRYLRLADPTRDATASCFVDSC